MDTDDGVLALYIVMGFVVPSLVICVCVYACCHLRVYKSMGQWCRKEPRSDTDSGHSENSRSVQRKLVRTWKKYEKGTTTKDQDTQVIRTVLDQDVISEICSVCWEDFAEVKKKEAMRTPSEKKQKHRSNHEFIGVVKSCGHYFHLDCLLIWMKENLICPMCRTYALLSEEYLIAIPLKSLSQKTSKVGSTSCEAPTTSGEGEKESESDSNSEGQCKIDHEQPQTAVYTISGSVAAAGQAPDDVVISVG